MKKKPRVECPNCGYENKATAALCNLCREPMPAVLLATDKPPQVPQTSQVPPPIPKIAETGAHAAPTPAPSEAAAFASAAPTAAPAPAGPITATRRRSFYDMQSDNRRNSNLLMFFLLATLTTLGAVIGLAYGGDPLVGAGAAFIFASIMGAYSWFGGKNLVLYMSGARKVERDDLPMLYNVVEEMKIASGLPMPEIYIITSDAPNAFATGRDPDNAAVAVTTGLLKKLNRDELQGVIAHEMSHVRNLDIRYAMLAGVIVGSVALICDAFLRGGSRSGGRGSGPLMILAVVFAIVAPLSARMLQLAISRQREFLADASAVELTRNPNGLASALAKIALDPEPLKSANRATQHMYIINPVKNFSMRSGAAFSTHPPTEARIRALKNMGADIHI